jgi:hypothetical protein
MSHHRLQYTFFLLHSLCSTLSHVHSLCCVSRAPAVSTTMLMSGASSCLTSRHGWTRPACVWLRHMQTHRRATRSTESHTARCVAPRHAVEADIHAFGHGEVEGLMRAWICGLHCTGFVMFTCGMGDWLSQPCPHHRSCAASSFHATHVCLYLCFHPLCPEP